jgi:steroid delta-isomerase-like uncharacterized protein
MLQDQVMTSIAENKTIVRQYVDLLFSKGDADGAKQYISEDFVNHDPPFGATPDRDGMVRTSAMIRAAFPNWHAEPFLLVGEDDMVVELFTASGNHTGDPVMGVEPSGREVTLQGINVFRLHNGLIVERWGRLDDLGFRAQLGVE